MQKSFSPVDLFHGEQWMLQNGMVSETLADTLMGYGYMQRGVDKVELRIDMDADHSGQNPKVNFILKLSPKMYRRYKAISDLSKKSGLWNKLKLFYLLRIGTPYPGSIEDSVHFLSRSILPSGYQVNVDVART